MNLSVHDSMAQHYAAVRRRLMGKPRVVNIAIEPTIKCPVERARAKEMATLKAHVARICKDRSISFDEMVNNPYSWKAYSAKVYAAKFCAKYIEKKTSTLTEDDVAEFLNLQHVELRWMLIAKPIKKEEYLDQCFSIIEKICRKRSVPIQTIMTKIKLENEAIAKFEIYHTIRNEVLDRSRAISFPKIGKIFNLHHTSIISGTKRYIELTSCDKSPH